MIKIKHQQELEQLQRKLEQQENKTNLKLERMSKANDLFKPPERKQGKIYIATSPEYEKQFMFKIGLTPIEISKRESALQTSCPNIKIVYNVDTADVDLTESLIHTYATNLNAANEFFYSPPFKFTFSNDLSFCFVFSIFCLYLKCPNCTNSLLFG